ncbi:18165_t:CDS:1, partial [Gigaspora rosea]
SHHAEVNARAIRVLHFGEFGIKESIYYKRVEKYNNEINDKGITR